MSRWGEDDKKSKGLVGCSIAFAVLGMVLYLFFINYQNLEGRRNLESEMQRIVRTGAEKEANVMIAEIREAASELGLELADEQLYLTKEYDPYNNPVIDVRIDFSFTVDLLVTQFEVAIPIMEEVTIVIF